MDVFSALADPTRRNILEILSASGQLTASNIYEKFSSTPAAVSQHLKILREANLVQVEKQAQNRFYKINPDQISEIERWAQKMRLRWSQRLDNLDKLLKTKKRKVVTRYGR